MTDKRRLGLISRLLSRTTESATREADTPQVGADIWADNASRAVHDLLAPLLQEAPCLVVTGYQDFLSSLAILLDSVPNLLQQPQGSYRIIFGSNTETRKTMGGEGRSVDAEARSHFLGSRGLSVTDLADLRAVLAVEAIERGIIQFRVFDQDLASEQIGRRPTMLHAKLFVGVQTVLSGSANFSLGGLRRNLEFTDDATAWPGSTARTRSSTILPSTYPA